MAINQMFAEKYAVPSGILQGFVLQDLKGAAPRFSVGGDFATYTGFSSPSDPSSFTRIDFVFGGNNGKWYVLSFDRLSLLSRKLTTYCRTADGYRVGTSLTDDGILASDHRPVFADLTI